jgi:hypothetical protein
MKPRAIAIAKVRVSAFRAALDSAKETFQLIADFMYGTPQRTRLTLAFAAALALLGCALGINDAHALPVCAL